MTAADLAALCRIVIERAPLALAVTDGETHRLRCVNATFCRLTGTAPENLLERPFSEAIPDSLTDGSLPLLDRVWRTGEAERITEVERRRRGRDSVFWSYAAWPALDDDGRPVALVIEISDATQRVTTRRGEAEKAGQIRDINERLLVASVHEQELAEQAEQRSAEMNALLESMSEGVIVIDAEGRILLINAAGQELFGLQEGDVLRQQPGNARIDLRRLDGEPLGIEEWPTSRLLQGQQFTQKEFVLNRTEGSPRRVVFSGSSIRDSVGRMVLAILVFRDVTELRELEELKEHLVSLVSHDLRTPLNAILGYAQLLSVVQTRDNRDKETGIASAIVRNARQMNAMIEDLLESARLDSGALKLHTRPHDVQQLVRETVENIASPEARSRIQVDLAGPLPLVPVDTDRLGRAIMNLLTNALKYSPPEAPVTVRIERKGDEVVVSVTDGGVGIPPEEIPQLFRRFFRAKTSTEAEGLGLGLYITRLIVEAHGGRIWAVSEVGSGSTFSFSLTIG